MPNPNRGSGPACSAHRTGEGGPNGARSIGSGLARSFSQNSRFISFCFAFTGRAVGSTQLRFLAAI